MGAYGVFHFLPAPVEKIVSDRIGRVMVIILLRREAVADAGQGKCRFYRILRLENNALVERFHLRYVDRGRDSKGIAAFFEFVGGYAIFAREGIDVRLFELKTEFQGDI